MATDLPSGTTGAFVRAPMLRRLARQLPRLHWWSDGRPFRQVQFMNELVHEACDLGADGIVPLDADEFVVADTSLPDVLAASGAAALAMQTHDWRANSHVAGVLTRPDGTRLRLGRATRPRSTALIHTSPGGPGRGPPSRLRRATLHV